MEMSVGKAIFKGLIGGLALALVIILCRYLVDGGNSGGFVSSYLLSPLGIVILVAMPVVCILSNLFGRNKKSGKKEKN